jgi:2-O-(6-phospho-alpha-D-mannosyl)-D-glycerate hydrolase
VRLRVRQPAQVTVLAYVDDVAGFGWRGWTAGGAGTGVEAVTVVEGTPAGGLTLANGLVTAIVDPEDGTYGIDDHAGLGRLVDGGDCGDTYNWCPPAQDTVVDRPESVDVVALERGPLRAQVRITARYRWPARAEGLETRTGEVVHEVVTRLELRAGERALRVETTIDNRSRDHRLRTHFPLPTPAASSRAETAFGTVERGLDAEGGPTEAPLPTYPALRFVQAGGLTVVHDGVAEYELVDIHAGRAHELALTLLRCTGMLSQVPMPTRPLPAGPLVRMEGPQLQKRLTRSYAVAVGEVDPFALADEVLVPLQVVQPPGAPAAGDADLPAAGAALAVEGAAVSAVVREGGALTLRVFNPRDEPAAVTIEGRRGWLVDLRGRPVAPFEGSFTLGPWEIATAALAD